MQTTTEKKIETEDIIRRGLKRELPCKLTDEEMLRIARTRVQKEAEVDQLSEDLRRDKKAREEQIDGVRSEVAKMGRELRSGEQDRTVSCNEVFRKLEDGTGWVFTIRTDTGAEVERRPANANEVQRYLPHADPNLPTGTSVIDEAKARQAAEGKAEENDVPEGAASSEDDVPPEGDDEAEQAADEGRSVKKRKARK